MRRLPYFGYYLLAVLLLWSWTPLRAGGQVAWPASGPEVCVVPSTWNVRPWSTCSDAIAVDASTNCADAALSIDISRGETESVQVLIRKAADLDDKVGGMSNVNVAVEINNDDASVDADIYQVAYVDTKRSPRYQGSGGGWRGDPLIPLTNAIDILPDVTQSIWISFRVSRTASSSNVTGSLIITCTEKCGKSGITIPIKMQVFSVDMPLLNESEIGSAWSGSWTEETFEPYYGGANATWKWNESKYDWFDMMMSHRMPPDSIYLTQPRAIEDYAYMAKKGAKWFAVSFHIFNFISQHKLTHVTVARRLIAPRKRGCSSPEISGVLPQFQPSVH